jgi:glutathione peroxidase
MSLFDFTVKNAKNEDVDLALYKGKVVLVVNVASQCGFTPQYEGLQKLYEKYLDQGFVILGFPCNQFGAQESGTDAEIQDFCTGRFGIRFPIFQKVDVNGENASPVFKFLKKEKKGFLGTGGVKWNFTKFLVGKDGEVLYRYASVDKPESIAADIETLLTK